MKRAILILVAALAAISLFAATKMVDGAKWAYNVTNGESEIFGDCLPDNAGFWYNDVVESKGDRHAAYI